jgi:hypothetical protein
MFPIGPSARDARLSEAPMARTAEEAAVIAGGPVFLASDELSQAFGTPAEAEAAFPDLYGSGRYELLWRDNAWRVALRYWRPAPPAPVARSAEAAIKSPLGHARTPEEARVVLGAPAELASESLPQLYVNRRRLMKKWGARVESGLAEIVEREGRLAVAVLHWRPMAVRAPTLAPAERHELAERIAAPMRSEAPQAPLDIGLFESLAPENPDIVLAEEGDGRERGA